MKEPTFQETADLAARLANREHRNSGRWAYWPPSVPPPDRLGWAYGISTGRERRAQAAAILRGEAPMPDWIIEEDRAAEEARRQNAGIAPVVWENPYAVRPLAGQRPGPARPRPAVPEQSAAAPGITLSGQPAMPPVRELRKTRRTRQVPEQPKAEKPAAPPPAAVPKKRQPAPPAVSDLCGAVSPPAASAPSVNNSEAALPAPAPASGTPPAKQNPARRRAEPGRFRPRKASRKTSRRASRKAFRKAARRDSRKDCRTASRRRPFRARPLRCHGPPPSSGPLHCRPAVRPGCARPPPLPEGVPRRQSGGSLCVRAERTHGSRCTPIPVIFDN